jgi:hypothetical protein
MDHLDKLRARLIANTAKLADLRKKVEQVELEQHKLGIAIEMIVAVDDDPDDVLAQGTEPAANPNTWVGGAKPKVSVKQLILNELAKLSPLTKMDIVSRLDAGGHQVNSVTVGTTLSKMVGTEVEKAGAFGYRLKGETPGEAGVSGATELAGSN